MSAVSKPRFFATLRVSRDTQDVANQRLGLLDYANRMGYTPLTIIEETAGRDVPWRNRKVGKLILEDAGRGDIVLTPEFTRLGDSPGQVFTMLEVAAERGVTIIITKTGSIMDGSLNAKIQAAAFSMASMIELEFIRSRTREGLARARLEGRVGGRRKGSTGKLKLDSRIDEVKELRDLEVSVPKMAKRFGVTEKTMRQFIRRRFPDSVSSGS